MNLHRSRQHGLLIERLENRELLAGNVTAQMSGSVLNITGDNADNAVTLTYSSTTHTYQVIGRDASGSPTTVNSAAASDPATAPQFSNVRQVSVKMAGGNDDFQVGSATAVDTVIEKGLLIDMGDGNDNVVLGSPGSDAGGATPVPLSLRIGAGLSVNLGGGNDTFSIANTDIQQNLNLLAGAGDDHVAFNTAFIPTGGGPTVFYPVRVHGDTTLNLGAGADTTVVSNSSLLGNLSVLDGDGAANIKLTGLNVSKQLQVNTGNQADTIVVSLVNARHLGMNTNGGADNVALNFDTFAMMEVNLGAGRDQLQIVSTKSSMITMIDGGDQKAALLLAGSTLRGLVKRHFL